MAYKGISRSKWAVGQQLEYIAKKVTVPNIAIVDSNFGMYKQDIEICKDIMVIRERTGWPKYLEVSLGKSKKILESISILKGGLPVSVSVQSTDDKVLENINRRNIKLGEGGIREVEFTVQIFQLILFFTN